ncbi:uncharacterized protein LOC143228559 [Tachypleus tridentatus]|uniref:uncharacterized protein LOC143228559 n=1 Tax=Tachypleus tridentatus TaxID=6853 RepID=UPI003FD23A8A
MGILKSCCCCKSLKTGSVACGIYTTVLYLMFLCAGIVHTLTVSNDTPLFCFSLLLALFSSLCVISSFLLFYGIFTTKDVGSFELISTHTFNKISLRWTCVRLQMSIDKLTAESWDMS